MPLKKDFAGNYWSRYYASRTRYWIQCHDASTGTWRYYSSSRTGKPYSFRFLQARELVSGLYMNNPDAKYIIVEANDPDEVVV